MALFGWSLTVELWCGELVFVSKKKKCRKALSKPRLISVL